MTKNLFEALTETIKNTSQALSKLLRENSIKNNQAIDNIEKKLLEIMNDRDILSSF